MRRAAKSLATASGLIGLNSFDFLVSGEAFVLIEINPRPGATLDIFEDRDGRLFQAHVDACRGISPPPRLNLPARRRRKSPMRRAEIAALAAFDWPEWTADRPRPGGSLRLYDPLCTIKACAADPPARARASRNGPPVFWTASTNTGSETLSETALSINTLTGHLVDRLIADAAKLRVSVSKGARGETIIDAGKGTRGGIEAGLRIAEICLGGLGTRAAQPHWRESQMAVRTVRAHQRSGDRLPRQPICRLGAVAWRGQGLVFRAWLGPCARARAKEPLFQDLGYRDTRRSRRRSCSRATAPPPPEIIDKVAADCGVEPEHVDLHLRADAEPRGQRSGRRARARSRAAQGA